MEITINAKQVIALVWTLIAIVLSFIVVVALGLPKDMGFSGQPWWLLIGAFFAVFLVITLPIYLLIALWGITTKYENE